MPTRWAQLVIVCFWLVMTVWLVRHDVLPHLPGGDLTYRQVLADRAVDERTHWILYLNNNQVGSAFTDVEPKGDGSFSLRNRTVLQGALIPGLTDTAGGVQVRSEFIITGTGRLQSLDLHLSIEGADLQWHAAGVVQRDELILTLDDKGEMRVPFDPSAMILDKLAPMDRLPDLRLGKRWMTRMVNPFTSLFAVGWLGKPQPRVEIIHNMVVDTQSILWDKRPQLCYIVEHKHDNVTARSWVRVRDGKVLRQETPIGAMHFRLELDPILERPGG